METSKRLYRSTTNKVIGGVASGLGDYFIIDPVLVRVLFVLLAMFGGGGVLIYIVLWIVIPLKINNPRQTHYHASTHYQSPEEAEIVEEEPSSNNKQSVSTRQSNTGLIAGIVLIFIGGLFLIDRLMPMYNVTDFWPLVLVALGVALIKPDLFKTTKNQNNEI